VAEQTEAQWEVFPDGDEWSYRFRTEGGASRRGNMHGTRAEVIAAAREERGEGLERVVLLRKDGSMHGELDHRRPDMEAETAAQQASLDAAGESGGAE